MPSKNLLMFFSSFFTNTLIWISVFKSLHPVIFFSFTGNHSHVNSYSYVYRIFYENLKKFYPFVSLENFTWETPYNWQVLRNRTRNDNFHSSKYYNSSGETNKLKRKEKTTTTIWTIHSSSVTLINSVRPEINYRNIGIRKYG